MFYRFKMEHTIYLERLYFGPHLMSIVKQKLLTEVEGNWIETYGLVVAVTSIDKIEPGMDLPGQGFVVYTVKYTAIIFRLFKGEIVDAVVNKVNEHGIFGEIGPVTVFVESHFGSDFGLDFDPACQPPCYKSTYKNIVIKQESKIRLKIVDTSVDSTGIVRFLHDFLKKN